jgi:hypothetical protein
VKGITRSRYIASWILCLGLVPAATGCVGLAAQILYVWQGTNLPAECRDLEYKKVCVVCESEEGFFNQSGVEEVSRMIEMNLSEKVKGIKLIPHKEVADWIDANDSANLNPKTIGKSVKAERVLYVQIKSFSIAEGETLFRGRATWRAKVYDVAEGGDPINQSDFADFRFPTNTERAKIDQNEESFRQEFIFHLARVIARRFHVYDKLDDIANDTPTRS